VTPWGCGREGNSLCHRIFAAGFGGPGPAASWRSCHGDQSAGHWADPRSRTGPFLPALGRVFTSGRETAFSATGSSLSSRCSAVTRLRRRVGAIVRQPVRRAHRISNRHVAVPVRPVVAQHSPVGEDDAVRERDEKQFPRDRARGAWRCGAGPCGSVSAAARWAPSGHGHRSGNRRRAGWSVRDDGTRPCRVLSLTRTVPSPYCPGPPVRRGAPAPRSAPARPGPARAASGPARRRSSAAAAGPR
jgi:hypothetical protein